MLVFDLGIGLGGWSEAFRSRGHEVRGIDIDPSFRPEILMDIMRLRPRDLEGADMILSSPPCETFSVASISTHWTGGIRAYVPKTARCERNISLVRHILRLMEESEPRFWIMENPRGVLRKLPLMQGLDRRTITLCQYGDTRMKPTDLWGRFPRGFEERTMCKNGDSCHRRAPRGSKTPGSTQGLQGPERSLLPRGLSLDMCLALEKEDHAPIP